MFENIWIILALVVVLIIVLFLVLRGILKLKNYFVHKKESQEAKSDLMVWKNVASLARGGVDSRIARIQMAKEEVAFIKNSFKECKQTLKTNFKDSIIPWFVSVGEPSCGKSTLLENSNQNIASLQSDEILKNGAKKSAPIRFWIGDLAVVADVSGKIFFDRWFDQSSAQWHTIIKTIKQKNKLRPLSGIILNIPADSLMADDEILTRKKANLIKTELSQLLNGLGMNIPCFVVITKMDVIGGFRQYFANVQDKIRESELGFKSRAGIFNESEFDEFWNGFISRLREGRNALMLNNQNLKGNFDRLDITSKIYMFSENLNDIAPNLEIYLHIIFGDKNKTFGANLIFDGVYFTSAKDGGYSLNKHFAALHNKTIDDAPLAESIMPKQRFFITNLFKFHIFNDLKLASFTKKELFRRSMLHFCIIGGIGILALFLFGAVVLNTDSIKKNIKNSTQYYNEIADVFRTKSINSANLVALDTGGNVVYIGQTPMPHDPLITREGFYITSLRDAQSDWAAPLGFELSSLIRFGSLNMLRSSRVNLFDSIRNKMLTIPLAQLVENKFITSPNEPVTLSKRLALISLLSFGGVALDANFQPSSDLSSITQHKRIKYMLNYALPNLPDELRSVLIAKQVSKSNTSIALADAIMFSTSYPQGIKAAIDSTIKSWLDGNIYKDSLYGELKNFLSNAQAMVAIIDELENFDLLGANEKEPSKANAYWNDLFKRYTQTSSNLNNTVKIINNKVKLTDFVQNSNSFSSEMLLSAPIYLFAYNRFNKLFNGDFAMFDFYDNLKMKNGSESIITEVIDGNYVSESYVKAKNIIDDDFSVVKSFNLGKIATIFTSIQATKDKPSMPMYRLLDELFDLGYNVIPINNSSLKTLQAYQEISQKKLSKLNEYSDKFKDDEKMSKIVDVIKAMYSQTTDQTKLNIVADMLHNYPKTALEVANEVSKQSTNNDILQNSKYLKPKFKLEYDPKANELFIKPFWEIASKIISDDGILDSNKSFKAIYNAMSTYTSEYIKYWANYADNLGHDIANYKDFLNFISTVNVNSLNDELYNIYYNANNVIAGIDDSTLPTQIASDKKRALSALEIRMNAFTPNFSDQCANTINLWLSLPTTGANMTVGDKKTASDYTPTFPIPWWNKLFISAKTALASSTWNQNIANLKKNMNNFASFPLYKNGDVSKPLSQNDLSNLRDVLTNITNDSNHENSKITVWANNMLSVINSLLSQPSGLQWTMFILDNSKQNELISKRKRYLNATAKFRYIQFSSSNGNTNRLSTISPNNEPQKLYSGGAELGNFEFDFYSYSDSIKPEASLKIPTKWAIINMYQRRLVIQDKNNPLIYYFPLLLTDSQGSDYLYYIGVEFGTDIVDKHKWPSQKNWLNFK